MGKEDLNNVTHHFHSIKDCKTQWKLTDHDSTPFGIDSKVLARNDSAAAALSVRLLMNLFKDILGGIVLQNDNTARIRANNDVV